MPDPAGFAFPPVAGNSSSISMTATTGFSELGPVEYLFTETSGNSGGSSSGWQSMPTYTDTGLQPSTTYSYTVTKRAGAYTGRTSAAAMATTASAGIPGNITLDGFVSGYIGGTPKTFTFDATTSDKLVVIVTGEHNFGGNTTGNVKTITYDGVSLTKAVEQNPVSPTLQTTSDLWYLDDPLAATNGANENDPSPATPGTIRIEVEGNGNNYVHAALSLSGTAPGLFGASAITSGTPAVNMNVSSPSSMVISWLTLGGNGNTASTATSIQANSPASAITFGGAVSTSNYAGHVMSRSSGLSVGNNTFAFNTGLTDVICLAAEFLAAEIPATAYQIWASQHPGADLTDPSADFDGGSLSTGIEWVLGGDPTQSGDDAGLAPTFVKASDPDGKFLFNYRRNDAATSDPNTTIAVEYGSDLDGWTIAAHQGAGVDQITISEVPDGPDFTMVTVAIPRSLASDDKLFARLKVMVATP
jgi:hypothetical protein